MRMMMMRRKMTQPAPMAAKRAGLEPKIPSTEPGLLSWFLVSERDKERRYEWRTLVFLFHCNLSLKIMLATHTPDYQCLESLSFV